MDINNSFLILALHSGPVQPILNCVFITCCCTEYVIQIPRNICRVSTHSELTQKYFFAACISTNQTYNTTKYKESKIRNSKCYRKLRSSIFSIYSTEHNYSNNRNVSYSFFHVSVSYVSLQRLNERTFSV